MTFKRYPANTELSSWLRSEGARRAREAIIIAGPERLGAQVMIALSGSTPTSGSREDRTCDRCGIFSGDDDAFHPFTLEYPVHGGGRVIVFGGLCDECRAKEICS